MSDQPISIHYQQMEEWLNDRRTVFGRKNKQQFDKLISLAPRLVQLVQYDIPAIQKQVKRSNNLLEECYRVCEEAARSQEHIIEKREQFLQLNDLRGVPPLGVDQELQAPIDERIERGCAALTESLQSYSRSHLHNFSDVYDKTLADTSSGMYAEGAFDLHFPWLARLRDEDALPTHSARNALPGDGDASGVKAAQDEGPQIDWGELDLGAADSTEVAAAPAVEIQWDVVEEAVVVPVAEDDQLPQADGVLLSLDISRSRDRANLIAEVRAALCFAGERARATNEARESPFVAASRQLIEQLTDSIDAAFVRMKSNFRTRDTFEDEVRRFHRTWTGVLARKASHQSRSEELEKEVRQLEPQQASLAQATRELRDDCLAQLQVIFPGRKIMIVGDINKYI